MTEDLAEDDDYPEIGLDDPCWVEVRYHCKGRPLDPEMEAELAFVAQEDGTFVSGRFTNGTRVANFSFRRRRQAEQFRAYVVKNFPDALTELRMH